MTSKLKLKAVQVPWSVAVDVTFMQIIVIEDNETSISFAANLLPKEPITPFRWANRVIMEVKFDTAYVRTSPSWTNNTIDPSQYDWTLIYPADLLSTMDEYHRIPDINLWKKYNEPYMQSWIQRGICGDPRMYEVLESDWLQNMRETYPETILDHFMILGRDIYVEILARNWSWKVLPEEQA